MIRNMIVVGLIAAAGSASAQIRITEWAYSADSGEFVEFTNVGNAPVDMTGWSYDDDSRLVGALDLSAFGVVQPGESVIITEATEASFRINWSLPASVDVIGEYTNNLGRNDEINLFDNLGNLADRLAYGDQSFVGSIRTQEISGNPINPAALGANDPFQWQLSFVGDSFGSYTSLAFEIGNPGLYIPAPASAALLGLGGLAAARRRR